MKKLLIPALLVANSFFGQLTYVDNFDGVYPFPTAQVLVDYNFDINSDGQNDIRFSSNGVSASYKGGSFSAISNSFGQNKINLISNGGITLDCTNDTLNPLDSWQNGIGYVYFWQVSTNSFMVNTTMGFGPHKQGFRLLLTNPANGSLGYKYGYINYTLTNGGDVIIHDWYYENTFNVPIVANSQLQYPYDGNCIHYDTVTVQDTIVTQVFDTITTQIFDTVLVSVTDTLLIETTLNISPLTQNTISVFPNPTNDHITINTGNFALMPNYSIKIENSLGQVVFTNPLNQQIFYIDLTGWSGNGIYYLKLLDAQNNIVTVRKIVLQ